MRGIETGGGRGPVRKKGPVGVFASRLAAPKVNAPTDVRKAQEALPSPAIALPIRPKLAKYTPAQRDEIVAATTKALHRYRDAPINGRAPSLADKAQRMQDAQQLASTGDQKTRTALHKFIGAQHAETKIANVLLGRHIQKATGAKGDPEALGEQASAPNPLTNPQAKARPTPQHFKFSGTTKIAGIPIPGLHQGLYSTGKILEQFDRPLHATAGAIYAAQHGGNPAKAALRGLENKDHYTTSDIMPAKSGNAVVDYIGALGGDILLNPASFVGGGAKPVAENLVKQSQRAMNLAEEAKAAGDMAAHAKYLAQSAKLAAKAKDAPTNRGIQVGLNIGRNGRYTSGKTSAKILRAAGVPQTAEHLREGSSIPAKAVQQLGHALVPGFRPAGVDKAEWDAMRTLEATGKAVQRTGTRLGERRGIAFERNLKTAAKSTGAKDVSERTLAAVEHAPTDPLQAAKIRDAVHAAPNDVPEVVARRQAIADRLQKARGDLKAARAETVRQQKTYEDSLRGAGVAHGRAQILSRNVEGTRAGEVAAIRGTFAGGGHGMSQAEKGLEAARANLQAAKTAERAAQKAAAEASAWAREQNVKLIREKPDLVARHAQRMVDALPAHSPSTAPGAIGDIANAYRKEAEGLLARRQAAGVPVNARKNYALHQWVENIDKGTPKGQRSVASGGNALAKPRKVEGSIAEINARRVAAGKDPLFSTNVGALVAHGHAQTAREEAKALVNRGLIEQGVARPVKSLSDLSEAALPKGHAAYVMDSKGLHAIVDNRGHIDMTKAKKLLKDGETVVHMNTMIGDRLTAHGIGPSGSVWDKEAMKTAGQSIDRFMSGMRSTFTVLNIPAYDLRNLTGDLWNAWLAGTKPQDLHDAARAMKVQLARHRADAHELNVRFSSDSYVRIGAKHRIPMEQALKRAEESGAIQTGYFGGERYEHVREAGGDNPFVMGRGNHLRHPVEALRSVGQVREDFVRFGTWLGAKRRGMSDADAAKWANKHHFDYTDLTDAERNVLRRVMLFWTFPARNTPLQISKLLSNPRPFATYQSAREEGAKQSGLPANWEHQMADYQQRGAGIPLKFGGRQNVLFPGAPVTDVSRLGALLSPRDEFNQTVSGLNPLIKMPFELGTNRNMFFNSPIVRTGRSQDESKARHWVPAPPFFDKLPGPVKGLLGVHKIIDKKTGKTVVAYNARADYLLRSTPQTGLAVQSLTPGVGSRGQTAGQKILSRSGVNVGNYDPVKNATNMYYKKLNELGAKQADARDLHGIGSPQYVEIGAQIKALVAAGKAAGIVAPSQRSRKKASSGGVTLGGSGTAGGVTIGGGGGVGGGVTIGG